MPEVSETQMALAGNGVFIGRVAYVAALQAMVVRQEAAATLHHIERDKLAQYVIANPVAWAQGLMPVIVGLTNVVAGGAATTDAALLANLALVWNVFAGIVTEEPV